MGDRPGEKPAAHLPQLDSLRGIACLMVLFAHLKAIRLLHWMPEFLGAAGVGIFFVLSGFLITRILIADREARRGLTEFYNRRVARIFPIYFLTLALLAAAWSGRELLWAANFTFNFRFLADSRDYFRTDAASTTPPVGHFWSLCVEEHFYWFWPFAVMLLPRFSLRFVLAAIVIATPFAAHAIAGWLATVGFSQSDVEGLVSRITYTQLVAISLGALAALHEVWLAKSIRLTQALAISRATVVGLVLIAAVAIWLAFAPGLSPAIQRATGSTALHLLCGGAFLVSYRNSLLGRLRWLGSVGTISYGLYLYHLPVYAALGLANTKAETNLFVGIAALATTFGLAAVSFRYIENPILRWVKSRGRTAGPKPYSAYFGKALTGLVAALFVFGMAKAYLDIAANSVSKTERPVVKGPDSTEALPQFQGFGATVTTLVVGSSHAEMGIATPEFSEPSYNLAIGGQDIWYDCEYVKFFVGRLPALKRIIFCVDPFAMHYSIGDTDGEKWRESLYFNASGFRARVHDNKKYNPIVLAAAPHSQYTMNVLKQKLILADEPLRGWTANPSGKGFNREYGRRRAGDHEALPSKLDENAALLVGALQFCKSKGLECVMVTIPTHQSYRIGFSPEYLAESTAALQRIVRSEGVPYFDYGAGPQFSESEYFDCDHLNKEGAIRFTKMFEADMLRQHTSDKK